VDAVVEKYQRDPHYRAIDLATMRQILAAMNNGRHPMLRDVIWIMKMVRMRRALCEREWVLESELFLKSPNLLGVTFLPSTPSILTNPRPSITWHAQGDREGTGTVPRSLLRSLLIKFRNHIRDQGGIVALVKAIDKDGDGNLDDNEIRVLLQRATGAQPEVITAEDVQRVRHRMGAASKIKDVDPLSRDAGSDTDLDVETIAKAVTQVRLNHF